MSKILGNIYDISIAIVFGTVFFSSFWRLWKLIFWQNFFQRLIFMFSFYPKNSRTGSTKTSITQELLVIENCPTPRWVTFLIFCRLVYDILSFAWPDFSPKWFWSATKIQRSAAKRSPTKFKASVWNFPISEQ